MATARTVRLAAASGARLYGGYWPPGSIALSGDAALDSVSAGGSLADAGPSGLSGGATLDSVALSGALADAGPSALSGAATLDAVSAAGSLYTAGASSGDLPANTISTGSTASTGVTYGQPFKAGAVGAGASLSGRQLNVITTWPDGSCKHGIVSRIVSGATSYSETLAIGTAATGATLGTADLPSGIRTTGVSITAGAFGSVSWTGTDWDSPFVTWFTGPVCSSWIYRKPLPSDTHLTAWLEVRLWSNGQVEVFPWVENGYLLVTGPTNKSATYTFSMGGTTRFSQSIDIKHHTRVPLLNTTTAQGSVMSFSHWLGTDPQARCVHDGSYVMATKLVPNLGWGAPSSATLNALVQNFTPNTLAGDDNASGGTGGAGNAIAPTQCLYLTSNADVRAHKAMMAHALSSGSWSHHYRDETTNAPLRPSTWPNIRIGYQDLSQSNPAMPVNTGGEVSGTGSYGGPAISHIPSYAYAPFLMTGRWWFLEEGLFWATYCYANFHRVNRGGASGIMQYGQPRYRAWALNSIAQALTVTPSSHPIRSDLVTIWEANTDRHRKQFVDGTYTSGGGAYADGSWVSPQGYLGDFTGNGDNTSVYSPYFNRTGTGSQTSFETYGTRDITTYAVTVNGVAKTYPTDWTVSGTSIVFTTAPANGAAIVVSTNANQWWTAPWMHSYLSVVFGLAYDLELPQSAQSLSDHIAIRNHAYKAQIQAAGDGYNGRANWRYISRYEAPLGTDKTYLPLDSYYTETQAAAVHLAELGLPTLSANLGGTLRNRDGVDLADGMAGRAYLAPAVSALALAYDHGVPGANEAYARVKSASNFANAMTNYATNEAPQWGVEPRLPTWLPAANTVADFTSQSLNTAIGRGVAFWRASGGLAFARWRGKYGRLLFAGGGHGDGDQNDVWDLDINTATFSQVKPAATTYYKGGLYCADPSSGWLWANNTVGDTTTQTGQPFAPHSAMLFVALPESAIPGEGASNGWLFWTALTAMPEAGQQNSYASHKLRLGIDTTYTHHSALNLPLISSYWVPYGNVCYDPTRRRVWYHLSWNPSIGSAPSTTLGYRDLATQASSSTSFTGLSGFLGGSNQTPTYIEEQDCIALMAHTDGSSYTQVDLTIWDLATSVVYRPTLSGTGPSVDERYSSCWVKAWGKMALVSALDPTRVWFLTPTGNIRTAAWAWSSRSIAGGALHFHPSGAIALGLNRLVPVEEAGPALIWCGREDQPIQVINVTPP